MSERFQKWVSSVPTAITDDPLWRVEAYRLAVFVADMAWSDVGALANDQRTLDNSDQLYRALCSIGANISEGYSRDSGRDRARFYDYALGSAREARGFYFHGRHVVGEDVALTQIDILSQIIRLLFAMARDQRTRAVREDEAHYAPAPPDETAPEVVVRVAEMANEPTPTESSRPSSPSSSPSSSSPSSSPSSPHAQPPPQHR